MKESKIKPIVIVSIVVFVAVLTYVVLNAVFSPYWDSVFAPTGYMSLASMRDAPSDSENFTKKQACEDIDYLIKRMKRVHPICMDGVPENVTAAAEAVKEGFGEEVTSYDIWRGCARVLHELNDAESMAAPSFPMNYLTDYSDKLDEGCLLEAINGVTLHDILEKNRDILSYELDEWGIKIIEGLVGTREGLKYLGVYNDTLEYTYSYPDGSTFVKKYTQNDFYNYQATESTKETPDVPYRFEVKENTGLALLDIDECVCDTEFKECLYNFFTQVSESDIYGIIIDLRDNSGGTSQVLDEILVYLNHDEFIAPGGQWRLGPYMMKWNSSINHITHLDDLTVFDGKVFVLTNSGTFSSAAMIAGILKDNEFADIIGETCGSMPDSYGEVVAFQTPNAAVTFQISSKHFERVDSNIADKPLTPNIEMDARLDPLGYTPDE